MSAYPPTCSFDSMNGPSCTVIVPFTRRTVVAVRRGASCSPSLMTPFLLRSSHQRPISAYALSSLSFGIVSSCSSVPRNISMYCGISFPSLDRDAADGLLRLDEGTVHDRHLAVALADRGRGAPRLKLRAFVRDLGTVGLEPLEDLAVDRLLLRRRVPLVVDAIVDEEECVLRHHLLLLGRSADMTNGTARNRQPKLANRAALGPASGGNGPALELEKTALRVQTAGVAPERPVGRDDAMAGHHDRDRIRADRATRGARGPLVPRRARDPRIGREVAVGHASRGRQDLALERRERREIDLDIESAPLAGEVLVELARHGIDPPRVREHSGSIRAHDPGELAWGGVRAVVDGQHATGSDGHPERSERRFDDPVGDRLEPFPSRTRDQSLARLHDHLVHLIASRTFFIASATRARAASSLP